MQFPAVTSHKFWFYSDFKRDPDAAARSGQSVDSSHCAHFS